MSAYKTSVNSAYADLCLHMRTSIKSAYEDLD